MYRSHNRLNLITIVFVFGFAPWYSHAALLESDFLFPIDRPAVLTTKAGGQTFRDTIDSFHLPENAYFSLDFDNASNGSVQIVAAKAGTVTHVGALQFSNSTIGTYWVPNVVVSHGDGIFTQYIEFATEASEAAAISQIRVSQGNTVQPGQVLGLMRNEKQTHLHFQVKYDPSGNGTGTGLSRISAPLGNITVGGKRVAAFDFTTPVGTASPINIGIKTTGSTNTPLNHIDSATVEGSFTLGIARDGELEIRDGAKLTSDGAQIGDFRGRGRGDVTVTNKGSSWLNDGAITIGDGRLVVQRGGRVVSNELGIGATIAGDEGSASVKVVDRDSIVRITSQTAVSIGLHSNGRLDIANGATMESAGASVGGFVGGSPNEFLDGVGRVTVKGNNSRWSNSGSVVIGYRGGKGYVTVKKGATASASTFLVGPGGVLSGDGRYVGRVVNQGGRVRPGVSPGTMFIDGDLTIDSGTVEMEVANGVSDLIVVSGAVNVGSTALFELFYDLLPETVAISGFFQGLDPTFSDGFLYSNISVFTSDETSVGRIVNVLFGNQNARIVAQYGIPSPVPLPSAFSLLLGAVFALVFFHRSRKKAANVS